MFVEQKTFSWCVDIDAILEKESEMKKKETKRTNERQVNGGIDGETNSTDHQTGVGINCGNVFYVSV